MAEAELKELALDIEKNGLRAPLVGWESSEGQFLLDGRNRLDAMALLGLLYETADHHVGLMKWTGKQWTGGKQWRDRPGHYIEYEFQNFHDGDPYAIALSFNVHRRHLTPEQRRERIVELLKANPEQSNRRIGGMIDADHKTVAAIRQRAEAGGEIPHLEKHTDARGRRQSATKTPPAASVPVPLAASVPVPPAIITNTTGKPYRQPRNIALPEFNRHALRLLKIIETSTPEWFANSSLGAADLAKLGNFLLKVAAVEANPRSGAPIPTADREA
jgi:hypothetical protein